MLISDWMASNADFRSLLANSLNLKHNEVLKIEYWCAERNLMLNWSAASTEKGLEVQLVVWHWLHAQASSEKVYSTFMMHDVKHYGDQVVWNALQDAYHLLMTKPPTVEVQEMAVTGDMITTKTVTAVNGGMYGNSPIKTKNMLCDAFDIGPELYHAIRQFLNKNNLTLAVTEDLNQYQLTLIFSLGPVGEYSHAVYVPLHHLIDAHLHKPNVFMGCLEEAIKHLSSMGGVGAKYFHHFSYDELHAVWKMAGDGPPLKWPVLTHPELKPQLINPKTPAMSNSDKIDELNDVVLGLMDTVEGLLSRLEAAETTIAELKEKVHDLTTTTTTGYKPPLWEVNIGNKPHHGKDLYLHDSIVMDDVAFNPHLADQLKQMLLKSDNTKKVMTKTTIADSDLSDLGAFEKSIIKSLTNGVKMPKEDAFWDAYNYIEPPPKNLPHYQAQFGKPDVKKGKGKKGW